MSKDYTNELNELNNELRTLSGYASVNYVDDGSVINVVNRDIQMPNNEVYAVCRDSNSQLLTFRVNRFIDGVDLSTKVASIKFVNAIGQSDRATPATLVTDDEAITFTWLLDNRVTASNGTVKFQIEFYEITAEDILYSWQTKMNKFEVLECLDVDGNIEQPTPSWLQSVMNEINKISNLTAEAKTLASNNAATAEARLVDGHYNILFGIPCGPKGDKGDAFTYKDFTDEEKGELLKLAIPEIKEVNEAAEAAEEAAQNAAQSEETASQALSDLLSMINSGDIVLASGGKLPLSAIPATATQEIYVVQSEEELTSLTAQRGDLAELVEEIEGESTITKTWQCLGNASVRDSWIVWGTSYAVQAGNAETANNAQNSNKINGHRLVEMSEDEFSSAVKDEDTYYLVY